MYRDRNVVAQLVKRAERAGFKAIALTVDTPRLGRREADIKNRYCDNTVDYFSNMWSETLTGCILLLHTGLPCHHFWHWRTLKAWTLARWTKYATTEFLLNCSWFRCLVTCCSHSYLRLQTDDSGLASYVAGQIDRTLSWKVIVLFSLLSLVELWGFLALITQQSGP